MKKILALLILAAACGSAQADECAAWTHKAYPVSMEACSYPNGGSGYVRITNNGNSAADVCWIVVFNSGQQRRSCYSAMPAGEPHEASCASCGMKNGGAKYVLLDKYESTR